MCDIKSMLKLYKAGDIGVLAVEGEISKLLTPEFGTLKVMPKIIERARLAGGKSFILFAIPTDLVEGPCIQLFIDANAIKEYCDEEEFFEILNRFKGYEQKILTAYHRFSTEKLERDITKSYAAGFAVGLYTVYYDALAVDTKVRDILPNDADVLKLAETFTNEDASSEDYEKAQSEFCPQIMDAINGYVSLAGSTIASSEAGRTTPAYDTVHTEMHKYGTNSIIGDRVHREIPYDFRPDTQY